MARPTPMLSLLLALIVSLSPHPAQAHSLAARSFTGGLCANGTCRDIVRVRTDGSWTHVVGDDRTTGDLTATQLTSLRRAISATRLPQSPPFTGTCPTAYDGSEVTYAWTRSGTTHRVASCTKQISEDDPLVSWWESSPFDR